MKVYCITSDNYLWAVRPFAYLFNKYWGNDQEVVVCGYTPPGFPLPSNFAFHSVSKNGYTQERWSDGLLEFLASQNDEQFVLMLEDYWLVRNVDRNFMKVAEWMLAEDDNILRIDLTTDRLHALGDARDARDLIYVDHYDVITTPPGTPYQMSLQAGIWNRNCLLQIVERGKTPWEVEIYSTVPENMIVMGTRQWPVRYANAIYKGKLDWREVQSLPRHVYTEVAAMIPQSWQESREWQKTENQ